MTFHVLCVSTHCGSWLRIDVHLSACFLLGQVRTHVLWPPGPCPPAGHFQYIPARCWMFWTFMIYIRSCEKADLGMNRIENGKCAPRYAALVDVFICSLCCICQRVTCCEYRLVKHCHIWWRCGTICQWQPSPTATDILLACSLASICQVPKMIFFLNLFNSEDICSSASWASQIPSK